MNDRTSHLPAVSVAYDLDAQAIYIKLRRSAVAKTINVEKLPSREILNVDVDFNGHIVGIELIGVKPPVS